METQEAQRKALSALTSGVSFFQLIPLIHTVREIPVKDRNDVIQLAIQLITPTTDAYARQHFINVVKAVPAEDRTDVVKQAVAQITPKMSFHDRLDIFNIAKEIPIALRLITPTIDSFSRQEIVNAIKDVSAEERDDVITQSLRLTPVTMDGCCSYKIIRIINSIKKVPNADLGDVVTQALRLITPETGVEGMIQIIDAIRETPAAKRDTTVTQALQLITPEMPFSNRLAILIARETPEALRLITPEFDSYEVEQVVNAVKGISATDRDDVITQTLRLITPEMRSGGYETRLLLNTVIALSATDRDDVITRALRLITPEMDAHDRRHIVNTVKDVPNALVTRVLQLITPGMYFSTKHAILTIARDIPAALPLIEPTMSSGEIQRISNAVRALPSAIRDAVVARAHRLITPEMDAYDRRDIVNTVKDVPNALVTRVLQLITPGMPFDSRLNILRIARDIPIALQLIRPTMSTGDRDRIISAVEQLPAAERDAVVARALRLITPEMDAYDRAEIVRAARTLSDDRVTTQLIQLIGAERYSYAREEIFYIARTVPAMIQLMTPRMASYNRDLIINAVRQLSDDRVTQVLQLITPGMPFDSGLNILRIARDIPIALQLIRPTMSTGEIQLISNAVRALPSAIRDAVVEQALARITPEMDATRASLVAVQFINAENSRRSSAALSNIQQQIHPTPQVASRELMAIDPAQLFDEAQNPTKPHELLIDLYNFIGATEPFPQIQYQNSQAIDVGGVTKNFVTQVMKAICHPQQTTWKIVTTNNGYMPSITSDPSFSKENQIMCCQAVGIIFSNALNRSVVTGNNFHLALYKMIHALTEEEIAAFDETLEIPPELPLYQKHQNLAKIVARDILSDLFRNISDNELDTFIATNALSDALTNNGIDEDFLEDRVTPMIQASLLIAKMLRARMQSTSWNTIKGVSPEQLKERIEGKFTIENVIDAFTRTGSFNSTQGTFLKRWINANEASEEDVCNALGVSLDSFNTLNPSRNSSEETLLRQWRSTNEISKDDLTNALGESPSSSQQAFLIRWTDKSMDKVKKLLFTMTGSETLTSSQTLTLNVSDSVNLDSITMHTCFGSMDMYPYSNYADFKSILEASLITPSDTGTLNIA
ncbi:MAG: hypothetical protein KGI80_01290 [Verrucomicrobiota bacterium]|nr:hypothetical protein [Verrucomicrobiota bacterium]